MGLVMLYAVTYFNLDSMSNPLDCSPCCATPSTISVPGISGASAISLTTADFVVPGVGADVTVPVTTTSWMVDFQNVYVGAGNFLIISSNSGASTVTLRYLGYDGDVPIGDTIASGSIVASGIGNWVVPVSIANGGTGAQTAAAARASLGLGAAALLAVPIPIASGGTAGTTKALAQSGLGLGQTITSAYVAGLAQDITATPTLAAGASITPAAAGLYLIFARATVDIAGATFSASRAVTLKVRNVTAGADVTNSSAIKNTQITSAASYPSFDWETNPVIATLAASQQIQLFVSIAAVPSPGTIRVTEATIIAIPLALS